MKNKALIFALFLSACSVGPDYEPPKTSVIDQWFGANTQMPISNEKIRLDWWTLFKDPLLKKYIETAADNNKDIKIALANVRAARARTNEAGSAFWPEVNGSGGADRSKASDALASDGSGSISNMYDAGFDASWEIDIFGGNRRAVEAESARVQSVLADYQGVMLSTLSETARIYYEARGLQKRIAITEENAELLEKTYRLVEERLQVGEASEFDVSRARGEYQLTRSRVPNLEADLRASIFSLSVLLGKPPETLLAEMQAIKPLPTPPDIVPVGLRSEILRRRPDIKSAERALAASIADIGVETAELFPKFFLTGDIGSQARVFGDLFSASGGVWSFGSLISWSIFEGGAIRARIEEAEAQSQAAMASYEKTVLESLRDVETALTRYGQELETRRRLNEGVQSRRKSVQLARELFDVGEVDYLAVLDAQRELTASEDDLVISETQSIVKLIALYSELGGGWELFSSSDF